MSAETLQAVEDAIAAHHRDECADEDGPRANAVVTSWVVAYEFSNVVDVYGEHIVGYMNEYIRSDGSPNGHIALAGWASNQIDSDIFSGYGQDGD